MTSARSVCMSVSRVSGAELCGVGSITLSGGKGSNYLLEHNIIAGMENSSIIKLQKIELSKLLWLIEHEWQKILKNKFIVNFFYFVVVI